MIYDDVALILQGPATKGKAMNWEKTHKDSTIVD